MKRLLNRLLGLLIFSLLMTPTAKAYDYELIVIPDSIFHVCENYFCYPEPSELLADSVINTFQNFKHVKALPLSEFRQKAETDLELKNNISVLLRDYKTRGRLNFEILKRISTKYNAKSALIISSYSISENNNTKRKLWEILEITNAFQTTYPFYLNIDSILTDNVNSVVMWSNHYKKRVTNSQGYFLAKTQAQANSQLEKLRLYLKNNVAENICENVNLRFFPKEVKTFEIKRDEHSSNTGGFNPNALKDLTTPKIQKELDEGIFNTPDLNEMMFTL